MGNYDLGVSIEDTSEKWCWWTIMAGLYRMTCLRPLFHWLCLKPFRAEQWWCRFPQARLWTNWQSKTTARYKNENVSSGYYEQDAWQRNKGKCVWTVYAAFDAIAGLVKILDFMKSENYSLSDLVNMIPDFYVSEKEVECSWNVKGKVIRQIIQENEDKALKPLKE